MAFSISGAQILVRGNETGLSLRTWAAGNAAAAKQLTANSVEAVFQIKIQNGAVFDTSDVALVINHRVEGQAQATTDSGIWRCKGGVVIVQGSANQFAEEWAIQDWDGVHVYVQKTGGNQSFIQSNPRNSSATSVRYTKFIVKSGAIDAHLQASGGTGTIQNVLFRNEGENVGIMGMRDTDTSDLELYRLEPFGWWYAPTTVHKNWTIYNPSANEININYRRDNGGGVFYNVINSFNGQRMTAIRYVSTGADASDAARSVLVGAYKPTLQSATGAALSGVEVSIRRVSDGAVEAAGVTGADGRIAIVAGSSNVREQSYNNTFTISGTAYTKIIRETGVKYIKQSITPVTTGGNVASMDQGSFVIVQRRADLLELTAAQSFLTDYEGTKTVFADGMFAGTLAQAAAITSVSFAVSAGVVTVTVSGPISGQGVYNAWKYWTSQTSQMAVPQGLITIANGVLTITGGMTTAAAVSAGGNVTGIKASGIIAATGAGSYSLPIEDSAGVRVTVRKSGGGNFNIFARRGTTSAYTNMGFSQDVSRVTYTVPKGQPVEVVMWSLGHVTYSRTISTESGGVVFDAEMTLNESINTALDVSGYLPYIVLSLDTSGVSPVFVITFNAAMTISGIEVGKALIHRLVGQQVALQSGFPPGTTSTIVINADEIANQLPSVRLNVGAAIPVAGRVYLDFYINTQLAQAINPAYSINPQRADGNQVQILRTKPALDPGYLAAKVVAAMPPVPTAEQNAMAVIAAGVLTRTHIREDLAVHEARLVQVLPK